MRKLMTILFLCVTVAYGQQNFKLKGSTLIFKEFKVDNVDTVDEILFSLGEMLEDDSMAEYPHNFKGGFSIQRSYDKKGVVFYNERGSQTFVSNKEVRRMVEYLKNNRKNLKL